MINMSVIKQQVSASEPALFFPLITKSFLINRLAVQPRPV